MLGTIELGLLSTHLNPRIWWFWGCGAIRSGPAHCFCCSLFSIYEKLIQFCAIDELGTNYPKVCARCTGQRVMGAPGLFACSVVFGLQPQQGTWSSTAGCRPQALFRPDLGCLTSESPGASWPCRPATGLLCTCLITAVFGSVLWLESWTQLSPDTVEMVGLGRSTERL